MPTPGGIEVKEEVKNLFRSLSQEGKRKEVLREALKAELREMVKEVLEEVAVLEREAFSQGNGAVGNGYYSRGLEGLFGRIEELRVPRTREGASGPSSWSPTSGHPMSWRSW